MGRILIIDDHEDVLEALRMFLEDEFDEVRTESSPDNILKLTQDYHYDVILLDMNFKVGINTGQEGFYWLKAILREDPNAVVILMTAYGSVDQAVLAIRDGAIDFVLKPWDNDKLLATIKSGMMLRQSRLDLENQKDKTKEAVKDGFRNLEFVKGKSKVMQSLEVTIKKIASTNANVLIMGENGTGKELVAREIHSLSNRSEEIFLTVDMASLSESIFESELFGHKKGSFTDAKNNRIGRFVAASGGTLFLDEIGNLSTNLQAKLLNTLQTREIVPLGMNRPIPIDIRLISATNKPLPQLVSSGDFREDLLYRINTITVELPALRDRAEDIPTLAHHFMNCYKDKYDKQYLKLSTKGIKFLQKYHWPGNVRELEHAIEKAVILTDSNVIGIESFQISPANNPNVNSNPKTLAELEIQAIQKAIMRNNGNLSDAAKELGITRQTIYNKMDRYGL